MPNVPSKLWQAYDVFSSCVYHGVKKLWSGLIWSRLVQDWDVFVLFWIVPASQRTNKRTNKQPSEYRALQILVESGVWQFCQSGLMLPTAGVLSSWVCYQRGFLPISIPGRNWLVPGKGVKAGMVGGVYHWVGHDGVLEKLLGLANLQTDVDVRYKLGPCKSSLYLVWFWQLHWATEAVQEPVAGLKHKV